MVAAVCLGIATLSLSVPVRGDDKATIQQLERELAQAIVAGDFATLDRLFADDFTHGSQSGRFRTKAEWLRGKEQGQSAYISFETESLVVRVTESSAVVTGLSRPTWREGDQVASGQFRFLRVWAKRNGQWRAIAFQSTAVPTRTDAPTPEEALDLEKPPATREFSIQEDRP